MISAALPDNEEMRLVDLATYNLQGTDTEEDFDDLSVLLAQYFNCPIALISVIDSDRQWFKGKTGTTETGNSRALSFCSHTLLQHGVMVVEDATKDERFFDNPVVAGEFKIRFYAGAPILSTAGFKLGTICIYDTSPRNVSATEESALLLFSKQITKLLELRKNNILLRRQAEELINFKNDIFSSFIRGQEEDMKKIAFNLHEDFAQGIAASLMVLQVAKTNKLQSDNLINKAVRQLKEILVNMRALSYTITPQINDWIATDELVLQFIKKIAVAFPFEIIVENSGTLKASSTDNMLCAIRIIEQWLKVLLKKNDIKNVHITLAFDEPFTLSVQDDGVVENLTARKKEIFESTVYDRVHAQGGTIELSDSFLEKNVLQVILP
jgi:hypothetical protein